MSAITPTDTRNPPPLPACAATQCMDELPADAAAFVAAAWPAVPLAIEIADDAARSDIETACREVVSRGASWYDMDSADADDARFVAKAFQYLRLRGEQANGFRTVYNPAFPSLIRFEAA